MKTPIALALCALLASPAVAQEASPAPAPPEAKVEAQAEAQDAPEADAFAETPRNFCGQQSVLGWLWQTEVGRELWLRQQTALNQAYPGQGVAKAREKMDAPTAPPADEPTTAKEPEAKAPVTK